MPRSWRAALLVALSCQSPVFAEIPHEMAASELGIGYSSVSAARDALLSKANIAVSNENGWTIASDRENYTVWSFAPPGDPAYPSVVKRIIVHGHGGLDIKMSVLCEAPKAACNQLVENFRLLNERMRDSLKGQ